MNLNIRVKHPENLPFLGHFTDPVDLSSAILPLTMQLETEHIEEVRVCLCVYVLHVLYVCEARLTYFL
jgi:hypothetical protein